MKEKGIFKADITYACYHVISTTFAEPQTPSEVREYQRKSGKQVCPQCQERETK